MEFSSVASVEPAHGTQKLNCYAPEFTTSFYHPRNTMPLDQSKKLKAERTELVTSDLWHAILRGFEKTGRQPNRKAVCLLMAQILGESAGKPWCWNLTNIKANSTWDGFWCEFGCGEEIKKSTLKSVIALADPSLVKVVASYIRDGEPWVSIKLTPPHPWTRFRAYRSLDEGLEAKWNYLTKNRYALEARVLEALLSGDIDRFNGSLFEAHFYTAGKKAYRTMLASRLKEVEAATKDYDWTGMLQLGEKQ